MALRLTRSIVPNLFTLGNLFSGFLAIVNFAHALNSPGHIKIGAMYILAAALFDMLDGIVARLTRSASELGVELDSLCDIVSFGLAPAMLLYVVHYHDYGPGGQILAALPAMAGAYRLARFNIQLTSLEDKEYFRGLPIPAGALTIVSYVVFYLHSGIIPTPYQHAATNFVVILTSLVMVSTIRYHNVPRPNVRTLKRHPWLSLAVSTAIILSIASKGQLVFPIMVLYILTGAFCHSIWFIRARRYEQLPFDEFSDD